MTIRGVSEEVADKLRETAEARGISVNTLVLELLERAVDHTERRTRLARYATATKADADALEDAIRAQRVIDARDWT